MRSNPPIPGHELLMEGMTFPGPHSPTAWAGTFNGGCRCGAKPDGFPHVSANAMKKWHRQHKAEVRANA